MNRGDWLAPGLTLRGAARAFLGHTSPRVLLPATAAALAGRFALGGWSRRDAVVPAVLVGIEPFAEWLIHVFVLHRRPRVVRGRVRDSRSARNHRAHHRDPRDVDLVLMPAPVVTGAVAATVAGHFALARSPRPAMTGIATTLLALTAYEWTHFLIHSAYRPRHAPYRIVWRGHRLHHYRNERYWFGVTTPIADHALATCPAKDEVPVSVTARSLPGLGAL